MPESISIRVPAATDGLQPSPESVLNPLYRYQLQVDGKAMKMGDLPKPYTVDSVTSDFGLVLPVRTDLPRTFTIFDVFSGRSALVQADGASKALRNETGLTA